MWSRLRSHYGRVLVAGLETGAAAGLAWWIASAVLDSTRPIYAPVAAVVVIGAGFDRRVGKVVSMLKGMGIAIVLSEIGVLIAGSGPVQIAVITAMAVVVTRLLADDTLAVVYAGLNAAILVGLGGDGWVPDRLLEALIGAAVAYALVYMILPPRPQVHIHMAIDREIGLAHDNLTLVAESLRSHDSEKAAEANRNSEKIIRNIGSLVDTFDFSEEVSRFSPWRRPQISWTEQVRTRTRGLQPVLRMTTNLIRTAGRMAHAGSSSHEHLAASLDEHAVALEHVKQAAIADEVTCDRATDITDHTDAARKHATETCGDDRRLHEAVVEEVVSLSQEIEGWTQKLEVASVE